MSEYRRLSRLILAVVVVVVALAAATSPAQATWGGNLPGKTWTTNGTVWEPLNFIYAEITGGSGTAICVGPVTHDSGGYHFPFGWSCAGRAVSWKFSNINAAAGVDNPNSASFSFGAFET
jgi:hypothetical protein